MSYMRSAHRSAYMLRSRSGIRDFEDSAELYRLWRAGSKKINRNIKKLKSLLEQWKHESMKAIEKIIALKC